ncbi:toprim domain-containing protein [Mesorhizobium sp. M0060]|uniref:DUF7146 domain-containing protein n=1 Tax=Mesorhizobium sp. M0060 TaxID=2956866 RepID=UPI00333ADE3A
MSALHDLARRLGGDLHGGHVLCPGPGHSAKDRSLSVWLDRDGKLHVHSFAEDDWALCMDDVRQRAGLPAFQPNGEKERPQPVFRDNHNERISEASRKQKIEAARRLWRESVDPRGTLVQQYLRARGLIVPDEVAGRTIRFHPACPWEGGLCVPAMITRFSPIENDLDPEAPPTAIHRTRIKPDGSGHDGKKMLGSVAGQCIKLSPDENVAEGLHLAEGVETSLALWQRGWRPIWAAATAGIMRAFPVLAGVECLTLAADHDHTGLSAAQECAERWAAASKEVFIKWPPDVGRDFADEATP